MKKQTVQVKAHFFTLLTIGMLFFDCFFGFLIYDSITHSAKTLSFFSSNPDDIANTWFPLGMISITLACAYFIRYFSEHETEKPAIWIDGDATTRFLGRVLIGFMLANLPLISLWSSNFYLAICLHLILFFADLIVIYFLRRAKVRKPTLQEQTKNSAPK